MRVLGVDPGLTRCGVGVVAQDPSRRLVLLGAGVVRTAPGTDHAHRLLQIEAGLEDWVRRAQPEAVSIERVFAQHNLRTVTGTAQAAGLAMLVAARHDLPVALHTPSEVKAAVTGSGSADKAQVGAMVMRILGLNQAPTPADAADAIALALCHLWRGANANRYAAAVAAASIAPAKAGVR